MQIRYFLFVTQPDAKEEENKTPHTIDSHFYFSIMTFSKVVLFLRNKHLTSLKGEWNKFKQ